MGRHVNRRLPVRSITPSNGILRVDRITEPSLVFNGGARNPDPKAGISNHGPAALSITGNHRPEIRLGYVGTGKTVDLAKKWIERCQSRISGPSSEEKKRLFPDFPGVLAFHSQFVHNERWDQFITTNEIDSLLSIGDRRERFEKALDLISEKVRVLAETENAPDVVLCALPDPIVEHCWSVGGIGDTGRKVKETEIEKWLRWTVVKAMKSGQQLIPGIFPELQVQPKDLLYRNFRRALKARVMRWGCPTQLILQESLEERRDLQPPATRAWNFCTALYYKAGSIPWTLQSLREGSCYVGVSFYQVSSAQGHQVHSSLAQVFSDSGDGIVLRGEKFPWDSTRQGKTPHLSEAHAERLLLSALKEYGKIMDTGPKRVVIHKTSRYWPEELAGFKKALGSIKYYDFVALYQTGVRAFRLGKYPPLRGTRIQIANSSTFLYTMGYMPELGTYPGGHVPEPFEIVEHHGDSPIDHICTEILGLTKMNWNSADFASGLPITIRFAKRIGEVMQEIPDDQTPDPRYRFYM